MSPALHGGFLTTGTPEKSLFILINKELWSTQYYLKVYFDFYIINITKMEILKVDTNNLSNIFFLLPLVMSYTFPKE